LATRLIEPLGKGAECDLRTLPFRCSKPQPPLYASACNLQASDQTVFIAVGPEVYGAIVSHRELKDGEGAAIAMHLCCHRKGLALLLVRKSSDVSDSFGNLGDDRNIGVLRQNHTPEPRTGMYAFCF
jgi:hypothetical protein